MSPYVRLRFTRNLTRSALACRRFLKIALTLGPGGLRFIASPFQHLTSRMFLDTLYSIIRIAPGSTPSWPTMSISRQVSKMPDVKLDRRIQRTRQLLRDSLIALILEKGYDAVTIQDITDHANLGRATF